MAVKKKSKSSPRRRAVPSAKALAEGGSESIVIYVHGIGKHPGKEELKLQWDLALFGRDLAARSRMARWSDFLHPDESGISRKALRSNAEADPRGLDLDALLRDAGIGAKNEKAQAFSMS